MRPSENNLYLVHYRTEDRANLDGTEVNKMVFYAPSPEEAKDYVESKHTDIVVMSVWQRVWSRGDDD